ncbi:N-formylglutamate amidohydrolase [Marinovum sp. 2_MG-2023]|uniref:N-formylglutamate amidohydrolase n=1 Tax=Roseobacteraceae TaxID=2854170 RepID=UPI001FD31A4F|nr:MULTISPECIES: N-formylglutamate amidohydrolase [Roseobacteraceae]MCJ7871384.1 N-formylglutamate amidohydrolase [Phaeobacter sp. J2-8]MDO6731527.1 N-formylglutamate amidohydrolase [Marinovum sp. 2_MG-2023]MDO6780887.1 N-formylglutamate amidohydrolase [Marinovum sp. 1_MG-2023]
MSFHPYWIDGPERPGRWLVTCDHATNVVPPAVNGGDLGMDPADMRRHIAFDPGAMGVSRHLAELLNGPALFANFSRLVIDPNRGEDDPTLLMKLYDGTIIPANRHADAAEVERRLIAYHRPYHAAYDDLVAQRPDRVICAVHSFTPQLQARPPRPWHIGILYAHDDRLALPLIERLHQEPDLCVDGNVPYSGHLPGDSIERHALATGLPNILIELRNDLIAEEATQRAWAERLAPILAEVLDQTGL